MPKSHIISVRLSEKDYQDLKKEAEFHHRNVSDHIRIKLKPNYVFTEYPTAAALTTYPTTNTATSTYVHQPTLFEWGNNGS